MNNCNCDHSKSPNNAVIRKGQPNCETWAVIPSFTVDTKSAIGNIRDAFVHVLDINTTYYIDNLHRVITTWSGPIFQDDYDYVNNPLGVRDNVVYDMKNLLMIVFDKQGNYTIYKHEGNYDSELSTTSENAVQNKVITAALNAETEARETADTTLQTTLQENIDALSEDTTEKITVISSSLAKETAARTKADTNLQTQITANADAIASEATTRATADTALQEGIDANTADITSLTATVATKADQTSLDETNTNVANNTADISTLKTTVATKADQSSLDETNADVAENAEKITQNASDISALKTELASANTLISQNTEAIDTVNTALSDEATAREDADTALQSAIDANATNIKTNTAAIATKASQADLNTANANITANTEAIGSLTDTVSTKADKATTLAGYGITNAYTKTEVDTALATKANQSSLDTTNANVSANTSSITALQESVATNTTDIATLQEDVEANTTDIAENATAIETINTTLTTKADQSSLDETNTKVSTNTSAIGTINTTLATKANQSSLDTTNANVAKNTSAIETINTTLDTKADQSDLDTTNTNVATNASAIETINTTLATKADQSSLDTTNANVATNKTNIATNASDIATLKTSTSTNAANISANTANIAENTSAIETINTTLATKANASDIPTKVSQLTNDSDYQTADEVSSTVSTAVATETTRVNALLDESYVTDVQIDSTTSTDVVKLTDGKKNILTGETSSFESPLPVASSTQAGIMNASMYNALETASKNIDVLLEGNIAINGLAEDVTQEELTAAFAEAVGEETPVNGAKIYDIANQRIWTYYSNLSAWEAVNTTEGTVDVSIWNNTTAGIIKGSTNDGQVYAESDGTGSVNGWDSLKSTVANNTSAIATKQDALTTTQLNAVNSGITSSKVSAYDGYATTIASKADASSVYTKTETDGLLDDKQDALTTTQLNAVNSGITSSLVSKLNGIATGAEVNVQSNWDETDTSSDAYIKNKPTAVSEFTNDADYVASDELATVATTGSYNDLSDQPTIPSEYTLPTATSTTKGGVYLTGGTGYGNNKTPAALYARSDGVAEMPKYLDFHSTADSTNDYDVRLQATSSDKNTVTLPSASGTLALTSQLPTVNDATLTIQKNGETVQTFTANQSTAATANITVPTKVSELTNDSGYALSSSLATVATTGSYSDLTGTPSIPTVNNGTLTITQNGESVATFTANQSTAATANITVPTALSELTNDSGYTKNAGTITGITTTSPLSGSGTSGSVALSHAVSGVTAGTYGTNSSTALTPAFGGTFSVNGFAVNATGHITSATSHTVKIPSTTATTSAAGLMSSSDKTKLNGIATGAEVNVQSDWSTTDTSADSYIKNKPTIPTVNDSTITIAQSDGTAIGSFTTNQSADETITLPAGTTYTTLATTDVDTVWDSILVAG